jgi:G3E family GTPase
MHPYLSLRYRPDGVVAVVAEGDALAMTSIPVAARRLAMADVIALSKTGASGEDPRPVLANLAPLARIVDAARAEPAAFVGFGPFDPDTTDIAAWLAVRDRPTPPLSSVTTFTLTRERAIPIFALDNYVELMGALLSQNLLRVRGLVATGEGESAVVEALGGFFRRPVLIPTPPGDAPATRFTVTAAHIDADGFAAYLDAFLNEARIDTPDRAALTDNPLSIAGFPAGGRRRGDPRS